MVARSPERFSGGPWLVHDREGFRLPVSTSDLAIRHLRKLLIPLCAALFLLLLPIWAQAANGVVKINHDRVHVDVEGEPLSLLFDRLARAGNFNVRMDNSLDRPVTMSISGRSLEQFLNIIGRQEAINLVIGWAQQSDGRSVIRSVDVLPEGNMDMTLLKQDFSAQESAYLRQQNKEKNSRSSKQRKHDREARRDERKARLKDRHATRALGAGLQ